MKRTLIFSAALGLCLTACGRIGYEPRPSGDAAAPDAPMQFPNGGADGALDASADGALDAALDDEDASAWPDTDAHSSDAGFPDAPPASGPRIESCPQRAGTAWFCDDFEQGVPDQGPSASYAQVANGNGNVSTAPQQAHTGSKSAHLRVRRRGNQPAEARLVWSLPTEAWNEPAFYMRGWFFLPPGAPVMDFMILLELLGEPNQSSAYLYDMDVLGAYPVTNEDTPASAAATFPRNRWACVELQVERPVSPEVQGRMRVFLDRQMIVDEPVAPERIPLDTYRRVAFGLYASGLREDLEAWMDDVVLSRAPIGCD